MLENKQKDFKNGRIYCIRNTINDDIYVGSTTQPLSRRMAWHRYAVKCKKTMHCKLYSKFNELGIKNFYIELIEDYPCESLEQLRRKEGHYIREMGTLNHYIAGRTRQEWLETNTEYFKEYNEVNKEYLKQYHKEYYETNKEYLKEYDKEYRERNKDKIRKKNKEYYKNNKDKILQTHKEYYEANKDKIKQTLKEHYEANKQYFKEYYKKYYEVKKEKNRGGERIIILIIPEIFKINFIYI